MKILTSKQIEEYILQNCADKNITYYNHPYRLKEWVSVEDLIVLIKANSPEHLKWYLKDQLGLKDKIKTSCPECGGRI